MDTIRVLFVHPQPYRDWQLEPLSLHIRQPLLESSPSHIQVFDHIARLPMGHVSEQVWVEDFLKLHETFKECQASVVFFSQSWNNISPKLYDVFRNAGAKVVQVLWDTKIVPEPLDLDLIASADYVFNCDSITNNLGMRLFMDTHLHRNKMCVGFFAGFHLPESIFRHETREKRYPVMMLGSNEGYRQTINDFLEAELPKCGIPFHRFGGIVRSDYSGPSPNYLDFPAYIETIWQSDILLSTQTVAERHQLKGKVLEFLACGGFCLVDRNAEYELFFPSGTIAYYENTTQSLLERIVYYHHRPEERRAIAEAGHAWFRKTFARPGTYWVSQIEEIASGESLYGVPVTEEHYQDLQRHKSRYDLAALRLSTSFVRKLASSPAPV